MIKRISECILFVSNCFDFSFFLFIISNFLCLKILIMHLHDCIRCMYY